MSSKIQLLLIEDNFDTRLDFEHCLSMHENFELCGTTDSEEEGLRILKKDIVDVLILDLELKEGDGLDLAEKMRKLPIRQPFFIVTTNNCSEATLQYLRSDIKVDFIFQKTNLSYTPERVLNIIERIYKYHKNALPEKESGQQQIERRIIKELENMGFSIHHTGTRYIASALLLVSEYKDEDIHMTKDIYPTLSRQFNTTSQNIERSIRTAIEYVWNNSNVFQLTAIYPYEVNNKTGRPSNGEFIYNMKRRIWGKSPQ